MPLRCEEGDNLVAYSAWGPAEGTQQVAAAEGCALSSLPHAAVVHQGPQHRALGELSQCQRGASSKARPLALAALVPVSAIRTAGHTSAILDRMLQHESTPFAMPALRMLPAALCAVAFVCPAAASAFAPQQTLAAQQRAAAAADAAVDILQLSTQLLQELRGPCEQMQAILSEVKSYAAVDLVAALALVMQPGAYVPKQLRHAAARFLAQVLASEQMSKPFLHSWVNGEEWTCPAALLHGTDAWPAETVPVGHVLIAGLLRDASQPRGRAALTDMGNGRAIRAPLDARADGHSTGATSSPVPESCFAMKAVLARSMEAKSYAVMRGMPARWAACAHAAFQIIGMQGEPGKVCVTLARPTPTQLRALSARACCRHLQKDGLQ
jgi:hypothetical protein